jgi:Zn-dependent M28 family amino/carboxypeptidase
MMTSMPGQSYSGPLPPLSASEKAIRDRLRQHVEKLAGEIGERNLANPTNLQAAAHYIEEAFGAAGYEVTRQRFSVGDHDCDNLEIALPGSDRADEIIIVGGHYDSVVGCPGANDNATGTAGVLELARLFAGRSPSRTIRFVAFVNEEAPYFQTDAMGSRVYARRCRERGENVVAMFSLETMGYYLDEGGSQEYPFPFSLFYPSTGNFIGFVGNIGARSLVRKSVELFRSHAKFPSEGGALAGFVPGVGWSDHWSFWKEGYPAVMVTDTAPFRYEFYHTAWDTPDKVDHDRLARVIDGLKKVIEELANAETAF